MKIHPVVYIFFVLFLHIVIITAVLTILFSSTQSPQQKTDHQLFVELSEHKGSEVCSIKAHRCYKFFLLKKPYKIVDLGGPDEN